MKKVQRIAMLHSTYPVGTIVTVGKPFMGNDAGTIGVVYEHYDNGCSIILSNGQYCGYSEHCLNVFEVNPVRMFEALSQYQFVHVGKLADDYRQGLFNSALNLNPKRNNYRQHRLFHR